MKRLYEKSELTLTLILIAVYTVSQSAAHTLNRAIGVEYLASALLLIALTAVLAAFIIKNGLQNKYGLCKANQPASKFLWFIPLGILVSRNLWLGAATNLVGFDLICYLCTMLCVGFVEEILFRGMLFRAIEKDNHRMAVVISSVTFGLGHILNMLNGVQSQWIVNICQVIGAIAIGFLFVMIFDRGGSLWPCIIAHSAIDMVSAFANEAAVQAQPRLRLLLLGALLAIVVLYILCLNHTLPRKAKRNAQAAA